jgi:hypothetical protein
LLKQKQTGIIQKYDLNTLHLPLMEPFLGSMYWTAATPLPSRTLSRQASSPSILTCSSSVCTSPVKNTVEIAQVTPSRSPGFGLKGQYLNVIDVSTDDTEDVTCEDDINLSLNSNSICIQNSGTKQRNVDTSHELLNYSVLDEDILDGGVPQTPRRLFEEEEMVTPSRLVDNSFIGNEEDFVCATIDEIETIPSPGLFASHSKYGSTPKLPKPHMTTGVSQSNISPTISEINLEVAQINHPKTPGHGHITPPKPLPPSPNIATFYGHWGSRRERHVSTLPSQVTGKPICLRVTETRPTDMFSYDPYYSSGTYVISTENNRPYGNGLLMRMGTQFMTLEDGRGCTLAVIKSRYTHVPSSVVYAPKPRFAGQAPSGHRLSNLTNGTSEFCGHSSELFPWALIRKEGRAMTDSCTVHLVDESIVRGNTTNARRNSGMFRTIPNFRGSHGFEGEWNTHTLVTRSVSSKKGRNKELPCCVIVRDPMNVDAVDITIAPGIDPLLMVCYLASHSKMDVEPIMGGF